MITKSITKEEFNKICKFDSSAIISEALRTNKLLKYKGWFFKAVSKITGDISDENSSLYIFVTAYIPEKMNFTISDETKCFY